MPARSEGGRRGRPHGGTLGSSSSSALPEAWPPSRKGRARLMDAALSQPSLSGLGSAADFDRLPEAGPLSATQSPTSAMVKILYIWEDHRRNQGHLRVGDFRVNSAEKKAGSKNHTALYKGIQVTTAGLLQGACRGDAGREPYPGAGKQAWSICETEGTLQGRGHARATVGSAKPGDPWARPGLRRHPGAPGRALAEVLPSAPGPGCRDAGEKA